MVRLVLAVHLAQRMGGGLTLKSDMAISPDLLRSAPPSGQSFPVLVCDEKRSIAQLPHLQTLQPLDNFGDRVRWMLHQPRLWCPSSSKSSSILMKEACHTGRISVEDAEDMAMTPFIVSRSQSHLFVSDPPCT